ncbi:type III secretion system HrpP C-terminal domain-containing protein [Pseudomonas poae]|uniref:type III secretion system HrpP C-terminal domain-containing protein n=1 Tax=Pseudomonas poae TaxID=200451 RepID=UPI0016492798|nr:type III secretion system HrpP C-terminal domain-containing protein [Pseudomonas poae]MBC3195494.1 type III secretion protein RspP [Pseudomonas poae]
MKDIPASKPERPCAREYGRDDESAGEGVLPLDYASLFARLFTHEQSEGGYVSSLPGSITATNKLMLEALAGQLAPRLQAAAQWPLLAVLYLPRLGRINARVQRPPGSWGIELHAEEAHTAQWLGTVQKSLQSRLVESLGQPVDLQLARVSPA